MLGDCYTAAVVEQLSKKELMALDAAYQDTTPSTILPHPHVVDATANSMKTDTSVVEMNNSIV